VIPVTVARRLAVVSLATLPLLLAGNARASEADRILEALALRPGDRVADVGAGSGEWTERLARAVGPGGHVWATEVEAGKLERIGARMRRASIDNVTTLLGDQRDTGLPEGCCDAVLLRLVYHHFQDPAPMRASLSALSDRAAGSSSSTSHRSGAGRGSTGFPAGAATASPSRTWCARSEATASRCWSATTTGAERRTTASCSARRSSARRGTLSRSSRTPRGPHVTFGGGRVGDCRGGLAARSPDCWPMRKQRHAAPVSRATRADGATPRTP